MQKIAGELLAWEWPQEGQGVLHRVLGVACSAEHWHSGYPWQVIDRQRHRVNLEMLAVMTPLDTSYVSFCSVHESSVSYTLTI